MVNKQFERLVGINVERVHEVTDNEFLEKYGKAKKALVLRVKRFSDATGKGYDNVCSIIKCPENYEYDCRVAVFMLLGVLHSDTYEMLEDLRSWPFGITKDKRTTVWCSAFQQVLLMSDFSDTLNLEVPKNGRMGRFGYQRLINIEEKLTKEIEKEKEREDEVALKIMENKTSACIEFREELDSLLCSTKSRKENWILEDIILGKSLSLTIYHWMRRMFRIKEVSFEDFIELIHIISSLKCLYLRNAIADEAFHILFLENNFSKTKIKEVTENMKTVVDMASKFYEIVLELRYHEAIKKSELNDKANSCRFMDLVANSLDIFIGRIEIDYRRELEGDLKNMYKADYDYWNDEESHLIEKLLISQKAFIGDEKKQAILKEERRSIKEGEEEKRVTINKKNNNRCFSIVYIYSLGGYENARKRTFE